MNDQDPRLQIVNTSGFPFQLRVAEEIRRTPGKQGWQLMAEERLWASQTSGQSGFIDVVAGYGIVRLVIECKRGADATWVFLVRAKGASDTIPRVRALCMGRKEGFQDVRVWADLAAQPESYESAFCAVRGQGDKEPMLERIAAGLLESTEAYADHELSMARAGAIGHDRVFVPVIVTAASLSVCVLDPVAVDLESGRLPADSAEFKPVPFIRFRKEMSSAISPEAPDADAARREAERTILVVQAKSLKTFLESWDLGTLWPGQWPHEAVRERMRCLKNIQGAG